MTAGQPASRYGLDCGSLVDPAVVSSLFTTEVAPVDPILSELKAPSLKTIEYHSLNFCHSSGASLPTSANRPRSCAW